MRDTHARFLPPSRVVGARLENALLAEGCRVDRAEIVASVVGIRTTIGAGASVRRSVLLGADAYDEPTVTHPSGVPLGTGPDVELDRVIVDKTPASGPGLGSSTRPGGARPTDPTTTSAKASSSCPKGRSSRRAR